VIGKVLIVAKRSERGPRAYRSMKAADGIGHPVGNIDLRRRHFLISARSGFGATSFFSIFVSFTASLRPAFP